MKLHIEFCVMWNYGPEFDRVSKIIKSVRDDIQISSNTFKPRSGAFEVELNGNLIFSKLSTGRFPEKIEVLSWF